MIDYTPITQQKIEAFETPFQAKLAGNNRWVELGNMLPWDELAAVYYKHLDGRKGRKSLNARIAIGAMIIKHKLNLSDRETVATISENPYMQHFLGLDVFQSKALFDASLFVTLRKRMGGSTFEAFNHLLIKKVNEVNTKQIQRDKIKKKQIISSSQAQAEQVLQSTDKVEEKEEVNSPISQALDGIIATLQERANNQEVKSIQEPTKQSAPSKSSPPAIEETNQNSKHVEDRKEAEEKQTIKPALKGKLKLDATVADIYISYPTDLDLLDKSRENSEKIIDTLCQELKWKTKPRTYRRKARKQYLSVIKKKRKSKKELRKAIKMELNCLKRNIGYIENLLGETKEGVSTLPKKYQDRYRVIKEVYGQQLEMYQKQTNKCEERIVSLSQPYVRPIVRGKRKNKVEFGPKLGLSLVEGYTCIQTLSWSAYHEGVEDFQKSVESYHALYGYYPEVVQVDQLYATRKNRNWAKEKGIRLTAKALGRPPKQTKETKEASAYERRKRKQEHVERNHIEGKIGQGKQGYGLNQIRTKTQVTAVSWINCIIFVMNIVRFTADMKKKKMYFLCFIYWLFHRKKQRVGLSNQRQFVPFRLAS